MYLEEKKTLLNESMLLSISSYCTVTKEKVKYVD